MDTSSRLSSIWPRFEALSAGLWDENSPRAVDAQAILEEYRSEIPRVENALLQAKEQLVALNKAHEQAIEALKNNFGIEANGLKKRISLLEKTISEKDAEIVSLLATLAEHEKRTAAAHAQALKAAAANEEASVQKMDELYRDLTAREAALEENWQKRHAALEADFARSREVQLARQSELEAQAKRILEDEGNLKRRTTDLEIASQKLQSDYRMKQQEIEAIKAGLQRSITELVRQYQSRIKDGQPLPTKGL